MPHRASLGNTRWFRRNSRPRHRATRTLHRSKCGGSGRRLFFAGRQSAPIVEGCLQQRKGADDVGLDEGGRAVDGAIDVAFGREMHDGIRLEALDHAAHLGRIDNIGAHERIAGAVRNRRQRFEIAGIGVSLSTTRTVWPQLPTAWRTTAEPMKPAPPVTRMRLGMGGFSCGQLCLKS